jgi:hypothetical protein
MTRALAVALWILAADRSAVFSRADRRTLHAQRLELTQLARELIKINPSIGSLW